jgi:NAD+ kinase
MLKHITLVQNTTTDPGDRYAQQVLRFCHLHDIQVSHIQIAGKHLPEVPPEAANPDLVVVLGGDGTFLRTMRCFVHNKVPLVGVNTGTLGFLTYIDVQSLGEYLERLRIQDYHLDERVMLQSTALSPSTMSTFPPISSASCPAQGLALNDVVVKNANPSQLCTLRLYVNDIQVAVYDADGLILSTPSGSTAYTMAAGGPVISPEVNAIAITPICPHSFSAKAVVVPFDKTFRVESATSNYDVVYALDGLESGVLNAGQSLEIIRSPLTCRMIRFEKEADDFYGLLKRKLHWAMNPRWTAVTERAQHEGVSEPPLPANTSFKN